jgi:hypothetical protein
MDKRSIFVLICAVSVANGILSPFIAIAFALSPLWMPEILPSKPSVVAYLSSLIVSTATLLLSGVPAALYERAVRPGPEDRASMYIWLGTAILLSGPAFRVLG